VTGSVARQVRDRLERRRDEMVELLGELVSIESGSDDPEGLAAMAVRLEELFGEFAPPTRHPPGHLLFVLPGAADTGHAGSAQEATARTGRGKGGGHTLVIGHYDTVWPRGTLRRMPFRVDDGVLTGPGCFDMKGGLVLLYFALRELRALGRAPVRQTRILLTCDEEIGSVTSRDLIADLAGAAEVAYVLESPLPGGALKTARKGVAKYTVRVQGRAAHAGIEPEKGASAIVEVAHQICQLHALTDLERGTTVNVGVVRGGTRPNVVAAEAEAQVDVRVATRAESERVHVAITGLRPVNPQTVVSVTSGPSRPPMERTDGIARLFARAREIAGDVGMDLGEGATGGGSDANLVAEAGVPTLDGLGPEGAGAHADHEQVLIESLPRRAALLAGLLAEV